MISPLSISATTYLPLPRSTLHSCGLQYQEKIRVTSIALELRLRSWDFNQRGDRNYSVLPDSKLFRCVFTCFALSPSKRPSRQLSVVKISAASGEALDYGNGESELPVGASENQERCISGIDHLLQSLHQSAKRFSNAIQCHELVRDGPELAKAWIGADVHAWHKHIACQAAVYAMLQTTKEMETMLYGRNGEEPALVSKIISHKISMLHEDIVTKLNTKDSKLVEWFEMEQLPVLSSYFSPSMEKWAAEYIESSSGPQDEEYNLSTKKSASVAVNILSINCCLAAKKFGVGCISSPLFTSSLPDMIQELMDKLCQLVSVEKLHSIASEAGFEHEFLAHFGSKRLLHSTNLKVVFWVSLVQIKLIAAFQREGVVASLHNEIPERDLATLGLFAFLGTRTRLFLSRMGIKDLDEPLKDFLSYLECGSLFIYPELSSISLYQLFIEVVTEEIGWLNFYAAVPGTSHQERKRSKQQAIQAEKEIILSTVFSVCSNVFSSFGHFSKSTQQSLDANLVAFLLRRYLKQHALFSKNNMDDVDDVYWFMTTCSKNLLNICLEEYWAAYDQSWKLPKVTEISLPELSSGNQNTVNVTISFEEVHEKLDDLTMRWVTEYMPERMSRMRKYTSSDRVDAVIIEKLPRDAKTTPECQSLLGKSGKKLMSTSSDIWMGTQLLFIDMSAALGLIKKKLRGCTLTKRERKKLRRTFADLASVIPVAILMLLPVSAVGHAAMLAAIKKYIPFLIPSPYSSERLDVVKQLNRTKKMEVQSWCSLDISSSILYE